jgi:uncharacterized lipoprotein YmbA
MRGIALFPTLLLVACAGPVPTTTRYLLPAEVPAGTARLEGPLRVGLGRVEVAPYLGDAGLVIETEPGQVRPARQHQWAEPLDEGLRRFLQIEISQALGYDLLSDATEQGRWDRTVDVDIDRLHGTLSGRALLVARWRVLPVAGAHREFRFAASQPLPRRGYAGLVEAEIGLIRQLAEAIARTLGE